MKRFFLILSAAFITATTYAQSAQYEGAMSQQVALLDDASNMNPERLQAISNTFERIADAEKTQWLPYYYAGYCQVIAAFLQAADAGKLDPLADKADLNTAKADSLSKNNDEIACLKSMVATIRIMVDPQSRGMQYGPEAGMQLEVAKQLNPENPRAYYLQAQALYYTPEQFGGNKVKAKELMELAIQKFSTFKPASKIAPHWGEPHAKELLGQMK